MFDCVTDFNKLEAAFCLFCLQFLMLCFFKNNSFYCLALVRSGIFFVNLVENTTKFFSPFPKNNSYLF